MRSAAPPPDVPPLHQAEPWNQWADLPDDEREQLLVVAVLAAVLYAVLYVVSVHNHRKHQQTEEEP